MRSVISAPDFYFANPDQRCLAINLPRIQIPMPVVASGGVRRPTHPTMSLKGLAKRFHRSHSKREDALSGDQDGNPSTRSISNSPSRTDTPGSQASDSSPVQMPTPETGEPVSMPITEPTPAPSSEPEVLPHSMDGALAELTPMQAQLDVGPTVKKLDKALDSMSRSS